VGYANAGDESVISRDKVNWFFLFPAYYIYDSAANDDFLRGFVLQQK